MERIITNWRYYAILALIVVAAVGMLCQPADWLSQAAWWATFAASKIIAILAIVILYLTLPRWAKGGRIPELTRILEED